MLFSNRAGFACFSLWPLGGRVHPQHQGGVMSTEARRDPSVCVQPCASSNMCGGCHNLAAAVGGAVVVDSSGCVSNHVAANAIASDPNLLWLAPSPPSGCPYITLKLGGPVSLSQRGEPVARCGRVSLEARAPATAGLRGALCCKTKSSLVRSCGVLCWHVYTSNPAVLDVAISSNGSVFAQHDTVHLDAVRGCVVAALTTRVHVHAHVTRSSLRPLVSNSRACLDASEHRWLARSSMTSARFRRLSTRSCVSP